MTTTRNHMTPFKSVQPLPPPLEEVQRIANDTGRPYEEVVKEIGLSLNVPMFKNNYYTVQKRAVEYGPGMMWHLSIRRNDRQPVHDWEDFQWIKNELCGPELEGCELYPKESRVINDRNQYHIYVFMSPDKMMPFGMGPVKTAEKNADVSGKQNEQDVQSV